MIVSPIGAATPTAQPAKPARQHHMSRAPTLTPQWKIWGLVAVAFILQVAAWAAGRALGPEHHTLVTWIQLVLVWAVIVTLAALATNRIEWLMRERRSAVVAA